MNIQFVAESVPYYCIATPTNGFDATIPPFFPKKQAIQVIKIVVLFLLFSINALAQSELIELIPINSDDVKVETENTADFVELKEVEWNYSDSKLVCEVNVGDLRARRQYQVQVRLKNLTGEPFLPLKTRTSCGCLVGIVKGHSIEANEFGMIGLRFRTLVGDVSQRMEVVSDSGKKIEFVLSGHVVTDFIASSTKFEIEDTDVGDKLRCEIAAQFEDIDVESVVINITSSWARIHSIKRNGKEFELGLEWCKPDAITKSEEMLIVAYKYQDHPFTIYQEIPLKFAVKRMSVGPKFIRFVRASDGNLWAADLFVYDLPKDNPLVIGDSVELQIDKKVFVGRVKGIENGKNATTCRIEFRATNDESEGWLNDWHSLELKFRNESSVTNGLKAVFKTNP